MECWQDWSSVPVLRKRKAMTKIDMKKDYIYSNAKLHYTVVSGNSDTPLILIHGQCMCGLDYEKAIEKLR